MGPNENEVGVLAEKIAWIAWLAVPSLLVYLLSNRLTPKKGFLRASEKLFLGMALIYLLNIALSPMQLTISENPLSSVAAGYLGLPGAVLAFIIQRL